MQKCMIRRRTELFFFAYTTLNASYLLAFTGAGDSYFIHKSDTSTNDHYMALST